MLQRRQSVFLLLAAIALSLDFFFPLASFFGEQDSIILYIYKIISKVPDSNMPYTFNFVLPLLLINSLCVVLSIGVIFMYKNRKAQMRIVKFLLFLVIVMTGLFFLYYVDTLEKYTGGIAQYNYVGVSAQLVAIVFYVIAFRGIIHDEKLISSADRLR